MRGTLTGAVSVSEEILVVVRLLAGALVTVAAGGSSASQKRRRRAGHKQFLAQAGDRDGPSGRARSLGRVTSSTAAPLPGEGAAE